MIPHGPGANCLLDFERICLISLGLKDSILKGVNSGFSGALGRVGNQSSWEKSISLGTLYVVEKKLSAVAHIRKEVCSPCLALPCPYCSCTYFCEIVSREKMLSFHLVSFLYFLVHLWLGYTHKTLFC